MSKKKLKTPAQIELVQGLFGLIIMPVVSRRRRRRGRPPKTPTATVGLPPALNDTAARCGKLVPKAAVGLIYDALRYSASHPPVKDGKRKQKSTHTDYQLWSMPSITTSMMRKGGRAYRQVVHDKLATDAAIKRIYKVLYKSAQTQQTATRSDSTK
jgi:hypothetical protein